MTDPKYTTPGSYLFPNVEPGVSDTTDNVVFTYQNTTSDYRPLPNSPDHTPSWARRGFPEFSPEEALSIIRGLLDVVDEAGAQGIDHITYERAREILAGE